MSFRRTTYSTKLLYENFEAVSCSLGSKCFIPGEMYVLSRYWWFYSEPTLEYLNVYIHAFRPFMFLGVKDVSNAQVMMVLIGDKIGYDYIEDVTCVLTRSQDYYVLYKAKT